MEFMVTANSGFITMGAFFLLIVSYVFILVTVWKRSSGSLCKALSTLSAHISVVILFFGPCIFVYMWPFPTVPVDKFLAILDFMITPLPEASIALDLHFHIVWPLFLFFFFFLGPHMWHMEVPRLGVELELHLRPTPQL